MISIKGRRKLIIGIIVFLFFFIYAIIEHNMNLNRTKQWFQHFDTTYINGKIEFTEVRYKGIEFKIEGKKDRFVFFPYTSEGNEKRIFDHLAEKGDIIIKPIHADTLRLINNGKEYLYTFLEF